MRRGLVATLVCGFALLAAGCGAVAHMTASSGNPALGKQYFQETFQAGAAKYACASCHTLAAAGATGTIGPNLDFAFGPDRCQGFNISTIRDVVRGQIAYADPNPEVNWPPTGPTSAPVQGMPPNLVTGQKAKDIAAYVAEVAGVTHGPGKHFDCQTGAYSG
jgi:cytochrome c peroxidase